MSAPSSPIHLTDLPIEILDRIFHHLPAKTICADLHLTCKRLYNLTRTPAFWTSYLKNVEGYEAISRRISNEDNEPWKRAFAFEHEELRWSTNNALSRYRHSKAHFSSVDALKLHEAKGGGRFAISGARDRALVLWDLDKISRNDPDDTNCRHLIPSAHSGWIWTVCIGEDDKSVFSCGFDSAIKQWEIVDGSLLPIREVNNVINHNEALLKCLVDDNMLYTSSNTGKILISDIRIGLRPQHIIQLPGRQAINCMQSQPRSATIFALCSQKGNMFCVDKRQMNVVKAMGGFRRCMKMELNSESLVASWKDGVVRYLNPETLKTEYTWRCPTPPDMKSLNPMCLSKGAFVYGHSYELMIFTPGRNPRLLSKLDTKEMIISVDYNNGDLACGMSEGVVAFWPRENQTFPIVEPIEL